MSPEQCKGEHRARGGGWGLFLHLFLGDMSPKKTIFLTLTYLLLSVVEQQYKEFF